MKRVSALAALLVLLAASAATTKGLTSKIRIYDVERRKTFDIVSPALLDRFDVWSGPGVFVGSEEEMSGFIIDWSSGAVSERPRGMRRYEVSFYVTPQPSQADSLAYVVLYEHDRALGRGFVYLPGRADRQYDVNVKTMLRGDGREGHWFRATPEWQRAFESLMP